jgi:hypothetical protein
MRARWGELGEFQVHVAERWRDRAQRADDPFARFVFSFAALKALYFFWSRVDEPRSADGVRRANELEQLEHLVGKLTEAEALRVLGACAVSLRFFRERRPIERMDKRRASHVERGDKTEGERFRGQLDAPSSLDWVRGLASIVYLVRSNLVHGSKMDVGDDEEVVRHATPFLDGLVPEAILAVRRWLDE